MPREIVTNVKAAPPTSSFSLPVADGGGETEPVNPWDFPPGSPGSNSYPAPQSFLDDLERCDPDMTVAWQPVTKRHIIWRKIRGEWGVVCAVEHPQTHQPLPLDNRVLSLLYLNDPARYGGWREMFKQVRAQYDRAEAARKAEQLDMLDGAMRAAREHVKIRVGYGRSRGDKAAMHSTGNSGEALPADFKL